MSFIISTHEKVYHLCSCMEDAAKDEIPQKTSKLYVDGHSELQIGDILFLYQGPSFHDGTRRRGSSSMDRYELWARLTTYHQSHL